MRKWILLAALTAGMFSMAALNAGRAEAMTLGNPAGLAAAAGEVNLAQDTAYVCRRVWRCGPYGCGWRRACWWTGGPAFYGPGPRWGYGPRWGHRHWRRW